MKSVGVVAAGRIAAALLQTLILVLLARGSDLREFGQFSVGYSIGMVIASVLNFGLPGYALRDSGAGAQERAPFVRGAGASLALLAAFVTFGVASVLELVTSDGRLGGAVQVAVAGAAAANVLSDAVSNINQSSLYAQGRVGRAVLVQLLVRVVPTAAVVGSVVGHIDPFAVLALAYLFSAALGTATSGRLRLERARSIRAMRASAQYWRESLWALLQQLDVTTVSVLIGDRAAGAYSAGFRLASPIHIVTASVSAIYVPRLSKQADPSARSHDARTMLRWGLLYTVLLVVVSPVAALIGPWLLGGQYAPTSYLFPIFVINSALSVMAQLMAAVLWAGGEARAVADATRTSTVIGLALIIGFSALHLLTAVALCTIVIQLILVPLLWRRLRWHWKQDGV